MGLAADQDPGVVQPAPVNANRGSADHGCDVVALEGGAKETRAGAPRRPTGRGRRSRTGDRGIEQGELLQQQ